MSEFPPASLRPLIKEVFELLCARVETISVAETVRDRTPSSIFTLQQETKTLTMTRHRAASSPLVFSPLPAHLPSTKAG